MTENEASRTLVKSPPELWAECSEASSLARHLGQFGEIRITRLEPETAVAWEGEDVSGTVRLEPSGWGTRVILTVQSSEMVLSKLAPVPNLEPAPAPPPEPQPQPQPQPELEPDPLPAAAEAFEEFDAPELPVKLGLFTRLFGRRRRAVAELELQPQATEPAGLERPAREALEPDASDGTAALTAALDSLGQAHHRPFSRG